MNRPRMIAAIGLLLCAVAWVATVSSAMSGDATAYGSLVGGLIGSSWLVLLVLDIVACGTALVLTKHALRQAPNDALIDVSTFVARVSVTGVVGIALFMSVL